jgi:hypothetical protein
MPIIGTITTIPLTWTSSDGDHTIPSEELDVVEIIPDTEGNPEVYVINKWYKPGRVPQIIHKNMVESWAPIQ